MTPCDGEGATHHTGCECHEARRDAEVARLRELARQAIDLVEKLWAAAPGEYFWDYDEAVIALLKETP